MYLKVKFQSSLYELRVGATRPIVGPVDDGEEKHLESN